MKYSAFGTTGLMVSQVALGTANFGTGWGHGADAGASAAVFNAYAEAGGNFIDTADIYQFGQSEELLGTLLHGRREDFLLATKYTNGTVPNANRLVTGNSRKAMVASVEASLKRLNTDRIDLFWAHHPDADTPLDELVRGFDDLARAAKILYAGLSNVPAWRLARAATVAELTRAVPVAAAQFEHSLVHRQPEADLLPAAHALARSVGRGQAGAAGGLRRDRLAALLPAGFQQSLQFGMHLVQRSLPVDPPVGGPDPQDFPAQSAQHLLAQQVAVAGRG